MIQKTARALLLTSVLAGVLATLAPQTALAISASPDHTGWSVSGKVYAYAHYGNVVYAAGAFSRHGGLILAAPHRRRREIESWALRNARCATDLTPIDKQHAFDREKRRPCAA